jgi:hypothetical protein
LSTQDAIEEVAVRPDEPVIRKEYRVRKGTIWNFQFSRGSHRAPSKGFVSALVPAIPIRASADARGRALLTLPTEGPRAQLQIRESDPQATAEIQTGFLRLRLDWEPGFQPNELEEILRLEGNNRRFRLVDSDEKSATLQAPEGIEPVRESGKLVLHAFFLHRDAEDFGALTGRILDEEGKPIAGARVGLGPPARALRDLDARRFRATNDPQGRYRLRDIPRFAIDGTPLDVRLTVTKEGYGGVQSPPVNLRDGDVERPGVVDEIRIARGVSLGGIVVDHRGQPVAGATVHSYPSRLDWGRQKTVTDKNGRFLIRDLHRGVTRVLVYYEKIREHVAILADGKAGEVHIKLPERMDDPDPKIAALRAHSPEPVAIGGPAPEWQVGPWSDGRAHKLAEDRGKVVVLY